MRSVISGAEVFFVKGVFIYDVRKILGFVDPPCQLVLFLSSAFWEPSYPLPLRTSYMEAPKAAAASTGCASRERATSETPKEGQYVKGIVVAVQRWRLNSTRVIC